MISIHNNFESVRLSRHISNRLGSLKLTFGRISTGLRIDRAGDDAAGLQISARLSKQIFEAQAEIKNITDETSLLQVANGALGESLNALQRMREIALSASNETLTVEDRMALEVEFKALMTHIDDVSENTTFNGKKILTREASQLRLSLMGNDDHSDNALSTALLPTLDTTSLGRQARYNGARRGVFLDPLQTGDLTINGLQVRGTTHFDDQISYCYRSGSAIAKAKAINTISQFTGVRAIIGENLIEGRESIREIDLDESKWLKINGHYFSGFKVEKNDASGTLRKNINAALSATGITASVTQDGHLVLNANDGRNITIEYGTNEVRDAFRIVDLFGDPINLSDTIDPAEYQSDGDASVVSANVSASGFNAEFKLNPNIAGDQSGSYGGYRDLVDYVIEIVDPGPLGVATYRIKQENSTYVAEGTRDTADEDYIFNAPGVIQEPNKVNLANLTTYYESASTREVQLIVTQEGNPNASDINDLPVADLILYNTSTGIIEEKITAQKIKSGDIYNNFLADYGISFQVKEPNNNKSYTNANGTKLSGQALSLEVDNLASGQDYRFTPYITEWTGDLKTEFTVEVISDGHLVGNDDPTGTPAQPARVTVHADVYRDGNPTPIRSSKTFDLSRQSNNGVSVSGDLYTIAFADPGAGTVKINFPNTYSTLLSGVSNPVWTSQSGYDFIPAIQKNTYVGTEDREYLVRFTSDGAFTNFVSGDGPSADLYANGVKVGSLTDVDANYFKLLGPSGIYEGIRIAMNPPKITSQDDTVNYNPNASAINFSEGTYNDENRKVVVEITKSGDTDPASSDRAEYKYYYADNPSVTLGTGVATFKNGVTLPDGLIIKGNASTDNSISSIVAAFNGSVNYLQKTSANTSYTRGIAGTMTATLSGTTTTTPFSASLLDVGQVNFVNAGGGSPDAYTSGADSFTSSDFISVTGDYVAGSSFSSTQDFYVFFENDTVFLTIGSDSDVTANVRRESSGITGSNTFNINGKDLTINYDSTAVDDYIKLSGSSALKDDKVSAFKLRVTEGFETPDYDLNVSWIFEDGSTSSSVITDVQNKLDISQSLGYGITGKFNSSAVNSTPLADGMTFTLTATPLNLKKGDRFTATLESMVHAGDELKVKAKAEDLVAGTEWTVTSKPNLWFEGEEYKIIYNHNFETPENILTSELSYGGTDSMGTLEITASGNFETGDLIRVKTRAFLGDVESSGLYTETLYPTNYIITVVEGGVISDGAISGVTGTDTVKLEWVREDGMTDSFLDHNGAGDFTLTSADLNKVIDLEEGVKIKFTDEGQGAYLATGDQIIIPVGQKLFYTFSGGISLQSIENIELSYSSSTIDNLMGRMMYLGPEQFENTQIGDEFILEQGLLGKNNDFSIHNTGLLTQRQINEAIDTIDVAINQISHSMTQISALSQRAIHRIENLNQKALDLMMVRSRIQDTDMAQETAKMASEQIQLMSAPLLNEISNGEALTVLDLIRQNAR